MTMSEAYLIKWVAEKFGRPSSAGGQSLPAAFMAILTAMAVARDQMLKVEEHSHLISLSRLISAS